MIPIRDTIQSRNYPIVNTAIIVLNVLIFFVELGQGSKLNQFIFNYGLVPARYSVPEIAEHFSVHLATVGRIVRTAMQQCEN